MKRKAPAAPTPTSTPRLLTIKDASQYLSAHVWFLRTLVWNRQIPFLKLGNRLLFDVHDLNDFIAARKTAVR